MEKIYILLKLHHVQKSEKVHRWGFPFFFFNMRKINLKTKIFLQFFVIKFESRSCLEVLRELL